MRKNSFRRGILKCFISFGYRKILWIKEGEIKLFYRIFFITVPKKSVGGNLSVFHSFMVWKKFRQEGWVSIKFFRIIFLSHSVDFFFIA